jgi:hypothetical protein
VLPYDVHVLTCVPSLVTNDRWVVENQIGKKTLAIDDCDSRQSIYVYGCKDSVLQVNGNAQLCIFVWMYTFLYVLVTTIV